MSKVVEIKVPRGLSYRGTDNWVVAPNEHRLARLALEEGNDPWFVLVEADGFPVYCVRYLNIREREDLFFPYRDGTMLFAKTAHEYGVEGVIQCS